MGATAQKRKRPQKPMEAGAPKSGSDIHGIHDMCRVEFKAVVFITFCLGIRPGVHKLGTKRTDDLGPLGLWAVIVLILSVRAVAV
jgi:hypothetical protein